MNKVKFFETTSDAKKAVGTLLQNNRYAFIPEVVKEFEDEPALIHGCDDGSVGVANFCGYRRLKEDKLSC